MTLVSIPIAVSVLVNRIEHQPRVDLGAGDFIAVRVLVHRDAVIVIVLIIQYRAVQPGIH